MSRKIAVVGRAASTAQEAPFDDMSWEIWAMPWAVARRAELYFEPHESWKDLRYYPNGIDPVEWLATLGAPVMLPEADTDIPNGVPIPWKAIRDKVGKAVNSRDKDAPYVESTVGIMLGYAAITLEPGDTVGIWGVDMDTGEEWAYQRPNVEYLIGFLRGMGVKVYIPPKSTLTDTLCPDTGRYGGKEMDFCKWGVNWGLDGRKYLYRDKEE
jgi:hypothetical protein